MRITCYSRPTDVTTTGPMQQLIKLHELVKKLKDNKSSFPFTNEMLNHLGNAVTIKLMQVFNNSWGNGVLPHTWREATLIPVYKKEKARKKAISYRPIRLTSCVVKILEKIINYD